MLLLVRASRSEESGPRSAYLPLGMIAVGLIIAYRTFSDFDALDGQDIAIMFLFAFALISMAGIQLFVVDKHKHDHEMADNHGEDPQPGPERR